MSRQAAASSKTAAPTLASAMPRPTGDPGHDPRRRARALREPCEPLAEGGVPGCARYHSAASGKSDRAGARAWPSRVLDLLG